MTEIVRALVNVCVCARLCVLGEGRNMRTCHRLCASRFVESSDCFIPDICCFVELRSSRTDDDGDVDDDVDVDDNDDDDDDASWM